MNFISLLLSKRKFPFLSSSHNIKLTTPWQEINLYIFDIFSLSLSARGHVEEYSVIFLSSQRNACALFLGTCKSKLNFHSIDFSFWIIFMTFLSMSSSAHDGLRQAATIFQHLISSNVVLNFRHEHD